MGYCAKRTATCGIMREFFAYFVVFVSVSFVRTAMKSILTYREGVLFPANLFTVDNKSTSIIIRVSNTSLSNLTRSNMPYFEQLIVCAAGEPKRGLELDRMVYCLRRRAQHETGVYFASLSGRTITSGKRSSFSALWPRRRSSSYPSSPRRRMRPASAPPLMSIGRRAQ